MVSVQFRCKLRTYTFLELGSVYWGSLDASLDLQCMSCYRNPQREESLHYRLILHTSRSVEGGSMHSPEISEYEI